MYLKSKIIFFFTLFIFSLSVFAQPIIAQYFGIWLNRGQTWQQKLRSDTPFDKLNRVYVSFGKIITVNEHLSIAFDGNTAHAVQLIQRIHTQNPKADIFLTVGGSDDNQSFGGAANDPEFAINVLHFLNKYNLNGFDIDWENDLNQQDLNTLVTHLYSVLHAAGDKLTLDVWPYPFSAYDMTVLKNNLNQINIMSYGATTPLDNSVSAFQQAGFPVNKMIGGVETETDYPGGTDTLGSSGSIAQKANYALQNGLAGMMGWRLDNDYATEDNPNYPTYQGAIQLWATMHK